MPTSADLGLPLVASQQGSPEITHNEAVRLLEALLKGVVDRAVNTPPGSPSDGDAYIVGGTPTGAWAGRPNSIAVYLTNAWRFVPGNDSSGSPIAIGARHEGMTVWVNDENLPYVWSGSAWWALFTSFAGTLLDDVDAAAMRTTLGLGTMATQAASAVSITGGAISGITDLAVADGGTGASTAMLAARNLGLPWIAGQSNTAVSHTGDTNETTLATVQLPAGAMGANGSVHIWSLWSYTNSANNKTPRIRFGGTGGVSYMAVVNTTTVQMQQLTIIRNNNAANAQKGFASGSNTGLGATSNAQITSSVDTTAAVDVVFRGTLANSGETITLEGYTVEVRYAA